MPLGRLAHLAGIWRKRVADAAGEARPHCFSRDELGTPGRRFGAFVVDSVLGAVAAMFILVPIALLGLSDDLTTTLWWFFGVPVAFAAVTVPFMVRQGEHAGQTLGKQLFGLRVVCDSHGEISRRRAAGRELLVKAPFWTGSIALLLPARDRQRRLGGPRPPAPGPPGPRRRHPRGARAAAGLGPARCRRSSRTSTSTTRCTCSRATARRRCSGWCGCGAAAAPGRSCRAPCCGS